MATGMPIPTRRLTASDLLLLGLFHDRIIPPLASSGLQPAIVNLLNFTAQDIRLVNGRYVPRVTTRCTCHSVPTEGGTLCFLSADSFPSSRWRRRCSPRCSRRLRNHHPQPR